MTHQAPKPRQTHERKENAKVDSLVNMQYGPDSTQVQMRSGSSNEFILPAKPSLVI